MKRAIGPICQRWCCRLLVSLAPCLPVLLLAGCTPRTPAPSADDEDRRLPRLETTVPQRTPLDVVSELTATVEAFEKAELCSQIRGAVTELAPDIDIGRVIKQREVLLTLDIPDL